MGRPKSGGAMIVALDGPAGSGKSTVARRLAQRLGFRYLDTGAMYRCVALAAVRRWGPGAPQDESERVRWAAAVGALAVSLRIELATTVAGDRVLLNGEDVTEAIRTSEVSEMASQVAAIPGVRDALVRKQQGLIEVGDWVAEGRDVGTVVAPAAELKVFLTADPAERARRRAAELGVDARTVMAEQAIRDARDSEREHSPLRAAADAVELDTSGMTIEQVVDGVVGLAVQDRSISRAAIDPSGRRVPLTEERWQHIAASHAAMRPHLDDVLETICKPAIIKPARPGEDWFYREGLGPSQWLKVVVASDEQDAFVVTAFPRRRFP
ncbi:MAG TPA: (d)CMP kinase [Solirubrobacteraceae bacterium]|jgi:cytidylate kinase